MAQGERIIPVNIEEQMKSSYIDYSMSVIVSRALPDVRDGLEAGTQTCTLRYARYGCDQHESIQEICQGL